MGWLRHFGPNTENAMLDNILTALLFLQFGVLSYKMYLHSVAELTEFAVYFFGTAGCIPVIKKLFGVIGNMIITPENAKKPRNIRKFGDQSWQLTIHTVATILELIQLNQEPLFDNLYGEGGVWEPVNQAKASSPLLNSIYLFQIAVWSYTAFSHRFHEARHKDYFVMYIHHVVTIALVAMSWFGGVLRIGLLIMFVHDSSDIIADLVKMSNYMGLDEKSGLYLTEFFFVTNILTWAYCRLYLFPMKCIWEQLFGIAYENMQGQENPPSKLLLRSCATFLLVLLFLNAYWFFLFLRIGYRLLSTPTNAHEVGREEYEGESEDSEDEDATNKKK